MFWYRFILVERSFRIILRSTYWSPRNVAKAAVSSAPEATVAQPSNCSILLYSPHGTRIALYSYKPKVVPTTNLNAFTLAYDTPRPFPDLTLYIYTYIYRYMYIYIYIYLHMHASK